MKHLHTCFRNHVIFIQRSHKIDARFHSSRFDKIGTLKVNFFVNKPVIFFCMTVKNKKVSVICFSESAVFGSFVALQTCLSTLFGRKPPSSLVVASCLGCISQNFAWTGQFFFISEVKIKVVISQ